MKFSSWSTHFCFWLGIFLVGCFLLFFLSVRMSLSFICQSGDPQGRKPEANQRNLTLPTLLGVWFSQIDHNSKYLGENDGGKCHGQFSFFSWRASWEYPLGLHPGWTMILFSQKYGNWKKLARSHGRKQTWELRSQFYAFLSLWRVRIVVECKVMKEKHHKNATAGSNS